MTTYYEYNEQQGRPQPVRASDIAPFHLEPDDIAVVWAIRDAAETARNRPPPQLMRRQAT